MTKFYSDLPFSMMVKIGTVSGLVGGFAIFLSIFMIDLSLNAGQGTFYKVVGLPLGVSGIPAILVGMILHMLTAALVGQFLECVPDCIKNYEYFRLDVA